MLQARRTRDSIVEAALACALEGHWATTSLQDVRRRAGVSNGSLFHHFPRRDDLTAALAAAALADHRFFLLTALAPDAEAGVTGVVRRHLRWVRENPELARLLLATPPDVLRAAVPAAAVEADRRFFDAVAGWLRERGWPGRPALPVVLALWTGPAQEYARLWLGAPGTDLDADGADLARGAWSALAPLLGRAGPEHTTGETP